MKDTTKAAIVVIWIVLVLERLPLAGAAHPPMKVNLR